MSYDIIREEVPSFIRRIGDHVLQGSNNTIIIMGTDRANTGPAKISDGLGVPSGPDNGKKTGTIHIIAGRDDNDGNPDLDKDKSYIYLSMKTDVDKNLKTDLIESDISQTSAAIMKSDTVRLVARNDVKIVIDGSDSFLWLKKEEAAIKTENAYIRLVGDKIIIDAGTIELGDGATEQLILGNKFMSLFNSHIHPTGTGPSGPSTIPMTITHLSQRKAFVK